MAAGGSARSVDEIMDATKQILNIGSAAIDVAVLVAEVGKEVPIASAVLQAFIAVHSIIETVRTNKEELADLRDRCSYLTACVIEKCRRPSTVMNLKPLEDCLGETAKVVKRCGERNRVTRILKAGNDRCDIEKMNVRMDRLVIDMGLSGIIAALVSIFEALLFRTITLNIRSDDVPTNRYSSSNHCYLSPSNHLNTGWSMDTTQP